VQSRRRMDPSAHFIDAVDRVWEAEKTRRNHVDGTWDGPKTGKRNAPA